jgi:hypothetical protein
MVDKNNTDTLKEIKDCSAEAKSTYQKLYDQMIIAHQFYNDDQWRAQDRDKIYANDSIPVTLNLIAKQVDALIGRRLCTLTDLKAYPVEVDDDYLSDLASRLLKTIMDNTNCQTYISQAMKDQLISGWGWLSVEHDVSNDIVSGDIKVAYDRYTNILVDPYCESLLDLSDADYLIRVKKISKRELKRLFPDKADAIDEIKVEQNSGSFFKRNQVYSDRKENVTVKEYWHKKYITKTYIINKQDDTDEQEWGGDPDRLRIFLNLNPTCMKIDKTEVQICLATSVNDSVLLQDVATTYKRFPFIPLLGYIDLSMELWEYRVRGYATKLIELQKQVNAHRSASMKVIMNMPLSGWIMDEGAVKDTGDLKRMGGKSGVIVRRPGRNIEMMSQPNLPASSVQMEQLFRQDINIVGSAPEVIGNTSNLESGKAISLMQSVGLVHTAELNEHLNFALRSLGQLILEIAFDNFTTAKIQRIVGASFPVDPAVLEAAKNSFSWAIKVDETSQSETAQYAMWESIQGQVQHGVPVPFASLTQLNPFLTNDMKASIMQQYQQQQAQQQAQAQAQAQQQAVSHIQSNQQLQPPSNGGQ